MQFLWNFIELFFPRICSACGHLLYRNESTLCTRCLISLPKTNFHNFSDNPVMETFWGQVNLQSATSFLYYAKSGRVQEMIHNFKYHNKREVGRVLGEMFASDLKSSAFFRDVGVLIPVPLHWTRLKKRGFNQSEIIARAMAGVLHTDVETDVLLRPFATETQTRKSKVKRAENVKGKFAIQNSHRIAGRHVLLVDDVITTGSTIGECATLLLEVADVKVSVASLGFAGK
jgi:ComF family protein